MIGRITWTSIINPHQSLFYFTPLRAFFSLKICDHNAGTWPTLASVSVWNKDRDAAVLGTSWLGLLRFPDVLIAQPHCSQQPFVISQPSIYFLTNWPRVWKPSLRFASHMSLPPLQHVLLLGLAQAALSHSRGAKLNGLAASAINKPLISHRAPGVGDGAVVQHEPKVYPESHNPSRYHRKCGRLHGYSMVFFLSFFFWQTVCVCGSVCMSRKDEVTKLGRVRDVE